MARKRVQDEGKSKFLRDYLQMDPSASAKAVTDAWVASGKKGTISGSYFYSTKAKLGLSQPTWGRQAGRCVALQEKAGTSSTE